MRLEACMVALSHPPPPPPTQPTSQPTLQAMLVTLGQLTEFWVSLNCNRGSVTLMYGDRRKKRMRGKKLTAVPSFNLPPAQTGVSKDVQGCPKSVAVPSGNQNPASTAKMAGKGVPMVPTPAKSTPRLLSTWCLSLPPTAPVEYSLELVPSTYSSCWVQPRARPFHLQLLLSTA